MASTLCPTCGGTGVVGAAGSDICPTCLGTGRVGVVAPATGAAPAPSDGTFKPTGLQTNPGNSRTGW